MSLLITVLVNLLARFRRFWIQRKYTHIKVILLGLLLVFMVRLLPFFAPIRNEDIKQNQLAMSFSDRHNLPLGTILTRDQEHTSVIKLNQVSPNFINAILAAEDASFYNHGALDLIAIIRAINDAIYHRRIVSGASTITMQLARMLYQYPRNLSGKIQEIWTAWRLAAGMNKNDILAAYINRLPMGGNIYGIEAAARIYFATSASELNLAQASLLAAIPNNPTYFNPYQNWERVKSRQKYILTRMAEEKYIKTSEISSILAEKLVLQSRKQGIIAAPHFLFWLAENYQELQKSDDNLSIIQTTIDRSLQEFVEAQVKQVLASLKSNNVHDAAVLVIDNYSREVLSYVGSPDYFNESQLGRNDGVQSLRQPGSTLKPFVYELGLETGVIRPNSILADVPTHYAIPGAKLYSPMDYTNTFLGPVRVRLALANSLNVPAVKVLEKIGVSSFLNRLHDLGFTSLKKSADYYGLGLTLGSGEVSLWELAKAYVTMANMGKSQSLITTLNNGSLGSETVIASPMYWQLIIDMLSDRYARADAFGIDSVLNLPFPVAVKTGTSSNYRDTWTVGFSTDYTVATWVGNFNGEPMRQISGVTGAAPLWNRIMLHLHEDQPPGNFPPPQGMIQSPICATTGLKPTLSCTSVVREYLSAEDPIFAENNSQHNSEKYTDLQILSVDNQKLVKQPSSNLITDSFRITSPRNGDLFLLYPGATKQQQLEFKVAFPVGASLNQSIEWWLNDQKLLTGTNNAIFWQLKPGKWRLEARNGQMRHQINFQVELANIQPTRQGFSVAHPTN